MKLAAVVVGLVLSLTCVQGADAKNCTQRYQFHLSSEGPWPASGVVQSGEMCRGSYRAGGTVTFKQLLLAEKPQHGTVGLIQGGYYTYRSAQGYSGPDRFMLRVCGVELNREGCANIQYNLTVVP